MQILMYQVDAFASSVFKGNPAAICILDRWLSNDVMQYIAAENNLSETAFLIPSTANADYDIRWFSPTKEVDLCGHATLAAAYVIFHQLEFKREILQLNSKSGLLRVKKEKQGLTLDFPIWKFQPIDVPEMLESALGTKILELYKAPDWMAVLTSEQEVSRLKPDIAALATSPARGIIVTAAGVATDFVSRSFFPALGIPEDPVTGSAHCVLTPYWAQRLGKTSLTAKQLSARQGELICRLGQQRVYITGQAVLYMKAEIYI